MNMLDVVSVGGGGSCGDDDDSGSLRNPITNPTSEVGKAIDDVARGINDFGSWLGGEIYDATH
ncbi:MAG TPA: hypothetical protein VFG73_07040 [Rhodanobacteraceae bacterium]|nr:hypothetical protein [Rhodanobacteraceae bacterium]